MEVKYETKKNDNSRVTLTITIPKEVVKKEFDEIVKKTQKEAVVPGFRKGKVPFSILAMKYKEAFLENTTSNIVEESFKEVFEKLEEKPLTYSLPELKEKKVVELDKDFSFNLEYDVFPEISFGEYKGISVVKDEVEIKDSDVKKIINDAQKGFSTVEEKAGDKVEKGNMVYLNFTVYENDKSIKEEKDYFIDTNLDIDIYHIAKDLVGRKKEEEIEIVKEYDKDDPNKEIAGKKFKIKAKINTIKVIKVPELTKEIVAKIHPDCKTEEELKNTLKKELDNYSKNYSENSILKQILDNLLKTFKGDIPESMIKSQNESAFAELVQNFKGDENGALNYLSRANGLNSKEEYFESIKDKSIKSIKKALIINEIQKKENITVTEDEIKEDIAPMSKMFKMSADEILDMYKKNNNLEALKNDVESKKVGMFLIENANITKTNKLSYEESQENTKNLKKE